MAVPFNFYNKFMNLKQVRLDANNKERLISPADLITEILNKNDIFNERKEVSFCQMKPVLEKIRNIISTSQVPPEMLQLFKKYLVDDKTSPINQKKISKLRLRSSTNSEDLEGFTGAGLYNSTGVWLYAKGMNSKGEEVRLSTKPYPWDKIEEELKKEIPYIYSSVWNDRAFEEREWYGINHQNHMKVKVGMALHEGVPYKGLDGVKSEMANGVAITTNIFDLEENYKLYINGQHFDLAVTNPPIEKDLLERDPQTQIKNYKTEEILVSTMSADPNKEMDLEFWPEWTYEVLSRSSVLSGSPVLLDSAQTNSSNEKKEVRKLSRLFRFLQNEFAKIYNKGDDFALDIEWKLVGPDRKIWIKQARPFARPLKIEQNNSPTMGFVMARKAPSSSRTQIGPNINYRQ